MCVWERGGGCGMLRALIRARGLLRLMATQLGLDVHANEADVGERDGIRKQREREPRSRESS